MKKIVSIFIALILSSQSFASQVDPGNVTKMIDEFEYDLTVTWDQKDQAYLDSRRQEFYSEFSDLVKKGLTLQEVLSAVEERVDSDSVKLIRYELNRLAAQQLTEGETLEHITTILRSSRSQGLSWNGEAAVAVVLSVAVVSILVVAVLKISKFGVNPIYCSPAGGWVDLNGDGFCNENEEVH